MPRMCVLCGKPQSQSFSVFSFPSSVKQRAAWIRIIMEAKPDFAKDKKIVQEDRLKNGICELHFLRSEISKGKKRRLIREAIPSLNISASQKCNAIIKSYKSLFTNNEGTSELKYEFYKDQIGGKKTADENSNSVKDSVLPECTLQIEIEDRDFTPLKVHKSMVDNIFGEKEEGICLCCGVQNSFGALFSVLKKKVSQSNQSLLEELSTVFNVPNERVIEFSTYVCRKCLKIMEDMLELRKSFHSLLSHLKNKFVVTSKSLEVCSKIDTYLEINGDKNSMTREQEYSLPSNSSVRRKSSRLAGNERKFTCEECHEGFESLAALTDHSHSYEDDSISSDVSVSLTNRTTKSRKSRHSCPTCNKKFCTRNALATHLNLHQQSFDCLHCGRYITSKARLNYHLYKFHGIGEGKEKLFHCKSCEKSFSSRSGLRYHEWSLHKAGKPYTCEMCNKVFHYRMLYNSHKLFAHGKKNIICEICGEMFFTISKLNVHVNAIHRNALTWLCKFCNGKFTTASAYRHHMTVRHKHILYNCSHCNAQFRKKYSLTQHLWKHTIFVCQRCDIKYEDSFSFVAHMAEIHKIDVSDKFNVKSNRKATANDSSLNSSQNAAAVSTSTKEVPSIVINDILMASSDFENSNLQPLSFQPENSKRREEDKSSFDELSNVDPLHFDSVDALEIQSVTNESMELEEDVSLINVQMLEDIHVPRHSNLKSLKNVDILPPQNQEVLNTSSTSLQNDLPLPSSELNTSSHPPTLQPELKNAQSESEDTLNKIDIMNNLTPPATSKSSNEDPLSIEEPLVRSQLEPTDLVDLPVILQPVKSNSWEFSSPLEEHSGSNVDPVIHSLAADSSVPVEDDPPITREIDITIPSEDEETKIIPLSKPITDEVDKIDDQELPSLSVAIDGKGEVHYKYVMYFEPTVEKS